MCIGLVNRFTGVDQRVEKVKIFVFCRDMKNKNPQEGVLEDSSEKCACSIGED
ncbi:hypothetical protein CPTD_00942 [Corynebacterium pseudotuberculosis]|nr:hypothetical protein CPTD_00942 [Corynebacterium pseudotuberculosis]